MTEDQAILIAQYVSALCPAQRFNEFTPDAWTDVLAPYDAAEARAAAVAVASRQPFIAPAELIAEIRARRADRIAAANLVYDGNPDETGAESARSVRALIRSAADGRTPPAAIGRQVRALEAAPSGRARAARDAVGRGIPRVREGVVNVLAVPCRRCSAAPGRTCTAGDRRLRNPHPTRLEDARRASAGLPPIDPAEEERELERRRAASAAALRKTDV
ncbi:hypothetical protein AB0A77_28490 [Streptomyces varsoviensis]|uniref:zinc finger domain-containing protein n=1 Tax=Streptomyces varsoviensis TaxID=67373 RepID=UPI0033D54E2D